MTKCCWSATDRRFRLGRRNADEAGEQGGIIVKPTLKRETTSRGDRKNKDGGGSGGEGGGGY
jgi:hypothetical protein